MFSRKYWKTETFAVSTEKEAIKIAKSRKKWKKAISYRLQFTDSAKFMTSSLSNLVNNIAEKIHRTKCKYGHDNKKWETCRIKYKKCELFLEYINLKDNLIK